MVYLLLYVVFFSFVKIGVVGCVDGIFLYAYQLPTYFSTSSIINSETPNTSEI